MVPRLLLLALAAAACADVAFGRRGSGSGAGFGRGGTKAPTAAATKKPTTGGRLWPYRISDNRAMSDYDYTKVMCQKYTAGHDKALGTKLDGKWGFAFVGTKEPCKDGDSGFTQLPPANTKVASWTTKANTICSQFTKRGTYTLAQCKRFSTGHGGVLEEQRKHHTVVLLLQEPCRVAPEAPQLDALYARP